MNIFCPNFSNPQVRHEFDQLMSSVGENRAYYLWSNNNGYSLDRTSDGSPSKLYQLCLEECDGDENRAIEMKSVIYSDSSLNDDESSFEGVKKSYKEYTSDKQVAEKEDKKPIRLHTLFDDICEKLNIGVNSTDAAVNGATIDSLRKFINAAIEKGFLSEDMKRVLEKFKDYDCEVKIEPQLDNENIMWYDGKTIHMTDSFLRMSDKKQAEYLLYHEFVHLAVSHAIENPSTEEEKALGKELRILYNRAKNLSKKDVVQYGMSSIQEFIAEFMSNPSFRKSLRAKNIYDKLVDVVRRIFGLKAHNISKSEDTIIEKNINRLIEIGYNNNSYTNGSLLRSILGAPVKIDLKNASDNSYETRINAFRNKIVNGLDKRIKSLKFRGSVSNSQLNEAKREIERLSQIDAAEAVKEFIEGNLYRVSGQTAKYAEELQDYVTANYGNLSTEEITNYARRIYDLNADFIGFYNSILKDLYDMQYRYSDELTSTLNVDKNAMKILISSVTAHVSTVNVIFRNLNSILSKQFILNQYSAYTSTDENGNEVILQDVLDAVNWVDSDINSNPEEVSNNNQRDVWTLTRFVGQNSSSNSSLIRLVSNELFNAKNRIERNTYHAGSKAKRLLNALLKNNGISILRLFQEKDDNGNTTGYFTRNLKYGLFKRDMNDMINRLGEKYNLEKDKNGFYIKPVLGDKNFEAYYKEYDDWMDKNCERRYTKEYYKLQRSLSKPTIDALEEINYQINKILSKTRNNISDTPDYMKLSNAEYNTLRRLKIEKTQLSSLYDENGNKKEGIDLQIALELSKLKELKKGKIKYKVDTKKAIAARKAAEEKYKDRPDLFNVWLARNTEEKVPDFYEEYVDKNSDEEFTKLYSKYKELDIVKELKARQKAILAKYKSNFKLGYDLSNATEENLATLKEIDEHLNDIFEDYFREYFEKQKGQISKKVTPSRVNDAYKAIIRRLKAEDPNNYTNSKWFQANHIISHGVYKPLSGWRIFAPSDGSIETTYNSTYNSLDVEESEFANPNYEDNGEIYQPKKIARYINKDYDNIKNNPEAFALYNELINLMKISNEKIAFQDRPDPYRLPQISGRMSSILRRSNGKVLDALKFQFGDLVQTKDDDLDFVERQDVRADGSKIKNVPVRFIRMLDDPSRITSDVFGSVIQFYQMAENYKVMTNEVAPNLEMIAQQAYSKTSIVNRNGKVETRQEGDTNVYKAIRKMLDMHVYGEKRDKIEVKIANKTYNLSKILDKFYNYVTAVHLAGNLNASLVGFFTAQHSANSEAVAGKYFNIKDHLWAKREFSKYLPTILSGLGSMAYSNKLICAMDYNGSTRDNLEIFSGSDQTRLSRFALTHWAFGTYTMGDTAVKGTTLLAIYHSYRLCNTKDGKKFISREEFVNKYYPKDRKKGNEEFDKQGICLWDAYEVVNEEFVPKKEYKQHIDDNFENIVRNRVEAINVRNDGNISELDRSGIFANSILHYLVQHKNFMILFQEMYKKRQFNFKTNSEEEGRFRGFFAGLTGIFNFKDGFSLKKMSENYDNLDTLDKYCFNRVVYDLSMIIALNVILAMFISKADDPDEKDNLLLQEIAYAVEKTKFEIGTNYKPDDIVGMIKTPAAASADINNLFAIAQIIFPNNWPIIAKRASTGAYADMPWIAKKAIKLTPIKNIVESFNAQSIKSKRKYQENQIQNN